MIRTKSKIKRIAESYNSGESIINLAIKEGVGYSNIRAALREHTDTLIHDFRARPLTERLQHNENQRIILATEIGEKTPEICGHLDRDQTTDGEVCRYCGLNFTELINKKLF